MSISKNQLKLITSLSQKKYRLKNNLFIAEGIKVINELLKSDIELRHIFCLDSFQTEVVNDKITRISPAELQKISKLKTPNQALAIFEIPEQSQLKPTGLVLALDDVNDPGNLGTIIRLCDWFGISDILCSKATVDCYNQKVVQASMGSLARVNLVYMDLVSFLKETKFPTFIADMDGENVYEMTLPKNAILIMGNEANGVSQEIRSLVNSTISIPQFGVNQQTESLNVATATAILLSEFKRLF